MTTISAEFLEAVASQARACGVFGDVSVERGRVACRVKGCEAPAWFRVEPADGRLWVSFVTPDRWLSESIESDLMHTGDKLEELIEEELVDLGMDARGHAAVSFQHYRSDDKLFTFRSPLPSGAVQEAVLWLRAYEACFRNLGDVGGDKDE